MNIKPYIISLSCLFATAVFSAPINELFMAAVNGNTQRLESLLAQGKDVNAKTTTGRTALMGACYNGNLRNVKLLLTYGADVNLADNKGVTALMDAVIFGDEQIVMLLIAAGADVNAVDKQNNTVLARARKNAFPNIIKILEQLGAKESLEPETTEDAEQAETDPEKQEDTKNEE